MIMSELFEPDETSTDILLQFARRGGDSSALVEALGLSAEEVETHLQELVSNGYLEQHSNESSVPTYGLAEKGKKHLAEKNLV
jgi:DNA-binding IclR family transcriptional regulator